MYSRHDTSRLNMNWGSQEVPSDLSYSLFLEKLQSLALKIAHLQRGEDHLQPYETLLAKYHAECQELADAANMWDEIPDVMYYASYMALSGRFQYAVQVEREILPKLGVTFRQAMAACLAKYIRRAAGHPKDIEAERIAIMEAVRSCPA